MSTDSANLDSSQNAQFATTRWTMVVAAGQEDSPASRQALEFLCRRYWFPLYAFLRRQGCGKTQAEDYVQGFFAHLLEKQGLQTVEPRKHKFRSFLLASLKNFVADDWRRAQAQRRGGGKRIVALEVEEAETRYTRGPRHDLTAERLFDRSWALTIIGRAFEMLEAEYAAAGKGELFERLKDQVTAEPEDAFYQEVAQRLGMTMGAARTAAHRLRRRLRELIRSEIAETVATPEQLEEEVRDLFAALEH